MTTYLTLRKSKQKFLNTRYGYRKGKGAKDAVKHLSRELNFGKYGYIVEADIKGYFQNINHEILLEMLKHDINDSRFIGLINKWLKAGIMTEENIVEKPYNGTPKGGGHKSNTCEHIPTLYLRPMV